MTVDLNVYSPLSIINMNTEYQKNCNYQKTDLNTVYHSKDEMKKRVFMPYQSNYDIKLHLEINP